MSCRPNRLPHIDPKFLCIIAALLPHSAGLLNRESLRAQSLCLELVLTASNCNSKYTSFKPSVAPSYIIVWHPPASCERRNCTEFNPSTGQGDTPISSTGCTCFLIDDWVEGQYVTKGVAHSPTPRCSSYWKRILGVALDYRRQLYFIYIYIYIYEKQGLVGLGFYGISTFVGYLMPNLLYTYISNVYDL